MRVFLGQDREVPYTVSWNEGDIVHAFLERKWSEYDFL